MKAAIPTEQEPSGPRPCALHPDRLHDAGHDRGHRTGEEWKLFSRHATVRMITHFVLHPVGHLAEGHGHSGTVGHGAAMHASLTLQRRNIFVDVSEGSRMLASPVDDLGMAVSRRPMFFVDVHLHTREILAVRDTPPGSGWGTVPTPMF